MLDFLQCYIKEHSYSPSYREIMAKFGFSSLGTIHKHLTVLKKKGYVENEVRSSRSLRLVEAVKKGGFENEVPLIGQISIGFPIEMYPQVQTLTLPSYLTPNPSHTYALRVKGDGLAEEHMEEGDLIIVETGRNPHEGDRILALINHHDTLIKKYFPEEGYVRLESQSSHLRPIILRQEDVHIQGIVVGLLRLYI